MTIYLSIHFGRIIVWQSWIVKRYHSWRARERTNSEKNRVPSCSALLIRLVFFSFSLFFNKKSHYVFTTLLILDPSVWLRHIIRSTFRGVGTYGDMEMILPHQVLTKFHLFSTFESWFDPKYFPWFYEFDTLFPSNF